ncbi:DUF397 domain-containing protein [Amycolatopsis aidingensis]|uniref:DUF397 domain-containing protein n=1 Tax=Amycolatopsis aidingensis TaxID=2842453 RepID=UPI001C0D933B|nr:DUF397 domain-containing protein [Amycolatopsis aidingensis]
MRDFIGVQWRKSSYTGDNDCVEVAMTADRVGIRDSKAPTAGALRVSRAGWRGLLTTVTDNSGRM